MPMPIQNGARTIRREAASIHHGRLVLMLAEEGVYYRQKGRRTWYLLPHGVAFQRAVELEVQRRRGERPRRRTAARKGR